MTEGYDRAAAMAELKAWKKSYMKKALAGPIADVYRVDPDARDVNGETIDGPINLFSIKYHPKKNLKKKDPTFEALWYKLASQPEASLPDIRDRVAAYAYSYENGFDPLTGDPLTGDDREKAIQPAKSAIPPIGDSRNNVIPDEANMKMLVDLIQDEEFVRAVDNLRS